MGNSQIEEILILAKTYPSPSSQYVETSCVAGINKDGVMRRLYPIPFRILEEGKQFKKWQWIKANIRKTTKDHRMESHRVDVETLDCLDVINTNDHWKQRRNWIEKLPTYDNFDAIQRDRIEKKISLALLKPKKVLGFIIEEEKNPDWTEDELSKLIQAQLQGSLFDDGKKDLYTLQKMPYKFYYKYLYDTPFGEKEIMHKIVDWEVCALYRNCKKDYGNNWQEPFIQKMEGNLTSKDLMFFMGNIHRFPHQWLIISLFYPPMQMNIEVNPQGSLF